MTLWTRIITLALLVVGVFLFASFIGLVNALITMAGFVLLGLIMREADNAKRAKRGSGGDDD